LFKKPIVKKLTKEELAKLDKALILKEEKKDELPK
jgi:hypothetical protein